MDNLYFVTLVSHHINLFLTNLFNFLSAKCLKCLCFSCSKTWKLVTVHENRHRGLAPAFCLRFLQSPTYHVLIILVTLANAIVTASISFRHTPDQKPRAYFFQFQKKFEIGFTIFYDLEVLFKIFCFSFNGYISRSMHKFELILAVMTTIHVLPIRGLFLSWISIFQVCF